MGKRSRSKNAPGTKPPENGASFPAFIPRLLKILFPILVIAIMMLGVFLRITNFSTVGRRSPDEGVYTYQAKVICNEGPIKGTRALVKEFNENSQLWVYPTPTRIGYDWLYASIQKNSGSDDIALGSYISIAASILSLILVTVMGLRFFNPVVTLFTILFMAVSPTELALARRTWQDALFGFLGLLTTYYALEIAKNCKKLVWYILFILTGSSLLLVKESGLIIFGLSALWILWNLIVKERSISFSIIFVTTCVIVTFAGYALLIYSSGGMAPYLELYKHVKEVVGTSVYGREYQSGPWVNFVIGLWMLSPLSFILFIVGAAGALLGFGDTTSQDTDTRRSVVWLALFSTIFFSLFLILPDSQNYRFVSIVFAPFYLIAGFGLWKIILSLRPFVKNIMPIVILILATVIIFAAVGDYRTFKNIVSGCEAIDLSVKNVLDYSK